MGLHPQKLIRTGVIMLVWCLLLVGAVSAVHGEEASSGGLAPPPVQPWGVNAYNLGGFGPGSSGSFDGAEGGDFGGGLGGPFFGPSTMPGFSPGYGMRPYDIRNNFMYNDMTMERASEVLEGVMVAWATMEALERATVALDTATVALGTAMVALGTATAALGT